MLVEPRTPETHWRLKAWWLLSLPAADRDARLRGMEERLRAALEAEMAWCANEVREV